MNKKELIKKFQGDWEKYWKVRLFEEGGWVRKKCSLCGRYFWTLDPDREVCDDHGYTFIGDPATSKKLDYIQTWREIERFFVKHGHESIPRYPVICRWFPGLYFTIASIVDFMRKVGGKTVFEMPANPLVVPQVCLRFNDIPNIGISGRHMSSFVMVGQHSLYYPDEGEGYWKDTTIDLDYRLLTEVFKVRPEDIIWHEDAWIGPSAFGTSLEYFVKGIEVGNAVFTQFRGTPENFEVMHPKVVDMGAGLERFTWMTQGTPTIYDAVYGPVIPDLIKFTGLEYDEDLFLRYAKLAASLDAEEVDLEKEKGKVAEKLGLSLEELERKISPIQALYAIADHSRTLAFAIADGGLPSNVGGGYNLRVIFRRAQNLVEKYDFGFEIGDVAEMHAKYLKPLFPEVFEHLDEIWEILEVEKQKHKNSLGRARRLVSRILESGQRLDSDKLVELYDSHGITPELIQEVAKEMGKTVEIPPDFYVKLTERHMSEQVEEQEEMEIDVSGFPDTKLLYYEDWRLTEFKARVLGRVDTGDGNWYVLDQTAFYPWSGGQDHDVGYLGGKRVLNVQKVGGVVIHKVDGELPVGEEIEGRIDWNRRLTLTRHHTATHIINGSCRHLLGDHVWQAGAEKRVDRARLDITHYALLSKEQIRNVEELANKIVQEDRPVNKFFMPRVEAEKKYGFRLYQGGAVPLAKLRIVDIEDWDTEACGGTHVDRTSEVGPIMILGQERLQDGVIRINFVAGEVAEKALNELLSILEALKRELGVGRDEDLPKAVEALFARWKETRKALEKFREGRAKQELESLALEDNGKFKYLIRVFENADMEFLREVSRKLSAEGVFLFLVGIKDRVYVFSFSGVPNLNAGQIVREFTKALGGGGGGPSFKGEGAAPLKSKDEIEKALEDVRKVVE